MFPLESPHQGDSNEYTQYTIFEQNKKKKKKKKITLNYPKSAAMFFFFFFFFFHKGLVNEFETAMVKQAISV